jgi:antitoxin CptB
LTRVSIVLHEKNLAKMMDCRVKPGNDGAVDNSQQRRADNRDHERYINPARHVRAFGVRIGMRMTGSTRSSDGLDDRRKRLLFRCWHRGTREMDLILGRFADAAIADLTDTELEQLEQLIEVPDPDLYAALSGDVLLAPEFRTWLFDRIKSFPADRDV